MRCRIFFRQFQFKIKLTSSKIFDNYKLSYPKTDCSLKKLKICLSCVHSIINSTNQITGFRIYSFSIAQLTHSFYRLISLLVYGFNKSGCGWHYNSGDVWWRLVRPFLVSHSQGSNIPTFANNSSIDCTAFVWVS